MLISLQNVQEQSFYINILLICILHNVFILILNQFLQLLLITMFIGVLLDISIFARQKYDKVEKVLNKFQKSWIQSIANIISNIPQYTLSRNHYFFVFGFGNKKAYNILSLIKLNQINMINEQEHDQLISKSLKLLSESGASRVCRWTNQKTVYRKFQRYLSQPLYQSLKSDPKFLEQVIQILPKSMKQQSFSSYFFDGYQTLNQMLLNLPPNLSLILRKITGVSYYEQFKQQKLIEITTKIKKQLQLRLLKSIPSKTLYNYAQLVQLLYRNDKQSQIRFRNEQLISQVRSFFDGQNRSIKRQLDLTLPYFQNEMLKSRKINISISDKPKVRTFLDGQKTSLKSSLQLTFPWFSHKKVKNRKKLLFVISDNHISDDASIIAKNLQNQGVTIISICINSKSQSNLLNLYSEIQPHWTEKTRSLFNIASPYKVMQLPGTVFLGKGWQHNIMNRKQVKLFLEINNPRQLENLFKFSEGIISHYNFFENIDSEYLNKILQPDNQLKQEFNYDNICAILMHLAIKRIQKRTGIYPSFKDIKEKLIEKYKKQGSTALKLNDVYPQYRLYANWVNLSRAIQINRPLAARFQLTQPERIIITKFFNENPQGVLTNKQLDISKRNPQEKKYRQTFTLASFNTSCILLIDLNNNIKYKDRGYFRIDKPETLNIRFYDIFSELENLSEQQKKQDSKKDAAESK